MIVVHHLSVLPKTILDESPIQKISCPLYTAHILLLVSSMGGRGDIIPSLGTESSGEGGDREPSASPLSTSDASIPSLMAESSASVSRGGRPATPVSG